MKVLVIGLGSMGKRRIRCLKSIGNVEIEGIDYRQDRRHEVMEKYHITVYPSLMDVPDFKIYDAWIISVSPESHMQYANLAVENSIPCFVEASVVWDGMPELIEKVKQREGVMVCPSCTMRFMPSVKTIKRIIDKGDLGKITNFSYHSGQYLTDWHPWEKVSDFYVSSRDTGGCREIVPFEMTWLNWIFGEIKFLTGFHTKRLDWQVDIDDVYSMVLQYKSGIVGSLVVDVISRNATRSLIVNGDRGQLIWDWNDKQVKVYQADEKRWIVYLDPEGHGEHGYHSNIHEEPYVEEMDMFLKSVRNELSFPNTLEDDYRVLKYLYEFESSVKKGEHCIYE